MTLTARRTKEFPCAHAQLAASSRCRRAHRPVRDPPRRPSPARPRRPEPGSTLPRRRAAAAAAKQKTTITVLPPISQAGKKAGKAKKAKTVVTATFTPAKKNRPVTLFVKSGGFKKVASTKTTKAGYAEFSVPDQEGRGLQGDRRLLPGPPVRHHQDRQEHLEGRGLRRRVRRLEAGHRLDPPRPVLQPGGPAQLLQGRPVPPSPSRAAPCASASWPTRRGPPRPAPPCAATAVSSASSSTASTGTSRPTATTTSATAWPRPG